MPELGSSGYKWKPISDLPEDVSGFRDRELESLFHAWTAQHEALSQEETLAQFNAQLNREWAIETGIIEGVYTLDRGVTLTLIERGIEASLIRDGETNRDPELVARTIQAHLEVLEGLFGFIRGERSLSTSYIKELHAALLKHQQTVTVFDPSGNPFETELLKGAYKILPNNPSREDGSIHEYCPPEHVAAEMDRLIELHRKHVDSQFRAELQAAWLHHAFTQIHPFQDGNGRVARSIATLVFLKAGFFPLVITRDERPQYIGALESADSEDLQPLVRLFCVGQKRLLTKAIGLAIDARAAANVSEAIDAVRDLLIKEGKLFPKDWQKAKIYADSLIKLTWANFQSILGRLKEEISSINPKFTFSAETANPSVEALAIVSRKLRYDPEFSQYHHSRMLTFNGSSGKCDIVVSFHGIGASFRGLLAVSAYFQAANREPVALSDDIFRISYDEPEKEITARFAPWLEACLVKGIELWRRTLA